jgi:hypothetical protein
VQTRYIDDIYIDIFQFQTNLREHVSLLQDSLNLLLVTVSCVQYSVPLLIRKHRVPLEATEIKIISFHQVSHVVMFSIF